MYGQTPYPINLITVRKVKTGQNFLNQFGPLHRG